MRVEDAVEAGPVPMDAAKTPVGRAPVAVIAVVLAVLITALGVAAVRDALVVGGAVDGSPWLTGAGLTLLDGITPAPWWVAMGLLLLIVGLWMVISSIRPRRRTGVALRARAGVFLRPHDVARLASGAAADVDGVLDARASASFRTVAVHISTTGDAGAPDRVRDAVTRRLSHLDPAPRVRVRTRADSSSASESGQASER